jgi:MFS family permease
MSNVLRTSTAGCEHPPVPWGVGDIGRNVAAVVQDRSLRLVLFAFAIFRPTESAQWIAILVYAYREGGTGAMGVAAVALLVPAAVLAPFVAQIGDRMSRERALALSYLAQGLAAGLTALALAADLPAVFVYSGAVVLNVAITATRPTHLSVLPELAETPAQLTAANALTSSLEGFAIFIGPLLAGVMIALEGPWLVFAVMAVALTVMGLALLAVHARSRLVTTTSPAGGALEGFREIRRRPGARLLLGFVTGQTAVIGALDVLTVILAYGVLSMGPAGPGVLSAAVGVGGLLGAAAAMTLIGRSRLAPAFVLGVVVVGVPIALVALAQGPLTAILLLGVAGVGKSFFDVTARTLLQRTVDDDVLARVFGVQEGLSMAALAVGSAIAPILVVTIGVDATFVLAGLSLPVVALFVLHRIRSVDRDARLADPADVALLRGTPIFEPLGPASIERVARNLVQIEADPGMIVIREGDPGDRFYVIEEGEVEVSRHGEPLAKLGPGDFFGEIALLRNVPRTATVTASGAASLRSLDRAQFLAAVTGSPAGAVALADVMDRRVAEHDD